MESAKCMPVFKAGGGWDLHNCCFLPAINHGFFFFSVYIAVLYPKSVLLLFAPAFSLFCVP